MVRKYLDYRKEGSLRRKLRLKRMEALLSMIVEQSRLNGSVRIIDIGGTRDYWNLLPGNILDEHNVTITVANLPGSGNEPFDGCFEFVEIDGCDLSAFADRDFHIAHSNSVIEHVGDWGKMKRFASELRRVANAYFVQTPSFWFPIEPHCMTPFFHWLPRPWRISLVMRFNLGYWKQQRSVDGAVETVESARLLDRKMVAALFDDAVILTERLLLFPKSYIAIRK